MSFSNYLEISLKYLKLKEESTKHVQRITYHYLLLVSSKFSFITLEMQYITETQSVK